MSRPLLPSTGTEGSDASSPTSSSRTSGPPGNTPNTPKPTYAKRGKITIVACVPCRKRKTKCDGQRPNCSQCTARDGDCNYDMTDDQRRLTYLREHSEMLEIQKASLDGLINSLQTSTEGDAQSILARLRSGDHVTDVADQVQDGKVLFDASRADHGRTKAPHTGYSQDAAPELLGSESVNAERLAERVKQYNRLMHLLSNCSPSFSNEVLSRIRRHEDVSIVLQAMEPGTLPFESLQLDTNQSKSSLAQMWQKDPGFPLSTSTHSTQMGEADIPRSRDQPWTKVTQDQELIGHLMKLYFTWQHCLFQNFPQKFFQEDFERGRTKYCTSALVNAICACGCFLSERQSLRTDRMGPQHYVRSFFDEAIERLNEETDSDVSEVSALSLISYIEGYRGRSAGQWMLSGRGALMALDLRLHLSNEMSQRMSRDSETKNQMFARSYAFWGSFNVGQCSSLMLGRFPVLNGRSISAGLPEIDVKEDEEPWESYELSLPNRPGARSSTFRKCAELSVIVNQVQLMFYAPSEALTGSKLVEEYEKYEEWFRTLPSMLTFDKNRSPPPHVLCLHMYYHMAVLLLFRPFLNFKLAHSEVSPREICAKAANEISNLWHLHRELFGTSGIWQFQLSCLLVASTIHVVNLPSSNSSTALKYACDTFQELQSWQGWAQQALHLLRSLVEQWKLELPQQVAESLYRGIDRTSEKTGRSDAHYITENALPTPASLASSMRSERSSFDTHQRLSQDQMQYSMPSNPPNTGGFSPHLPTLPRYSQPRGDNRDASKRSNLSPLPGSSAAMGAQGKRQRVLSPMSPSKRDAGGSRADPTSPASFDQRSPAANRQMFPGFSSGIQQQPGTSYPQHQQVPQQQQQQQQSQDDFMQDVMWSNYMYNPLPSGQPPMLYPPPSRTQQAPGPYPQASGSVQYAQKQAGRQQAGRPSDDAFVSMSGNPSLDQTLGTPGSIEGLSFAEDWRAPYLTFQSPDNNPDESSGQQQRHN